MRVVVDANVAIRAVLRPAGTIRRLTDAQEHGWYAPAWLRDELREHEEELAGKLGVPASRWRRSVERLEPRLSWVPPGKLARHAPRARRLCSADPDDAPYVACALAIKADYLWTFDKRLAEVAPCRAGPWPETP